MSCKFKRRRVKQASWSSLPQTSTVEEWIDHSPYSKRSPGLPACRSPVVPSLQLVFTSSFDWLSIYLYPRWPGQMLKPVGRRRWTNVDHVRRSGLLPQRQSHIYHSWSSHKPSYSKTELSILYKTKKVQINKGSMWIKDLRNRNTETVLNKGSDGGYTDSQFW